MRMRCATGGGRSCAFRSWAFRAALFSCFLVLLLWPAASRATVVYYTANTTGEVRRTDGRTTTTVLSGLSTPRDLAFGPDGLLYVAEENGSRITRIDTATRMRVGSAFATTRRHIGVAFGA